MFSLVYKIYHSVRIEKHITYLPSAVSGNCDINTERLGSHAALSATHVMSNVHDIRLRMCNAILRLRKFQIARNIYS